MSDREKGGREGERERESEIEIGGGRESKKENCVCIHLVMSVYYLCIYVYVCTYMCGHIGYI